jgi:hypothetical protein
VSSLCEIEGDMTNDEFVKRVQAKLLSDIVFHSSLNYLTTTGNQCTANTTTVRPQPSTSSGRLQKRIACC